MSLRAILMLGLGQWLPVYVRVSLPLALYTIIMGFYAGSVIEFGSVSGLYLENMFIFVC